MERLEQWTPWNYGAMEHLESWNSRNHGMLGTVGTMERLEP